MHFTPPQPRLITPAMPRETGEEVCMGGVIREHPIELLQELIWRLLPSDGIDF